MLINYKKLSNRLLIEEIKKFKYMIYNIYF